MFSSLTITNTSILPQTYGFIDIPACVSIQPNDGFGELPPNDSMEVDVIFSAKEPKEYAFDLICKSGLDKYVLYVTLIFYFDHPPSPPPMHLQEV